MEQLSLSEWIAVISSILLFISEVMPFSKKMKSNGIFQGVLSILGMFKKK